MSTLNLNSYNSKKKIDKTCDNVGFLYNLEEIPKLKNDLVHFGGNRPNKSYKTHDIPATCHNNDQHKKDLKQKNDAFTKSQFYRKMCMIPSEYSQ